MGRLDGRTCLIIGGTGGIGLASARRFLNEGARLAVTGRTQDEVNAAATDLAWSDRVRGFACDVGDPSSVSVLFEQATEWLGGRLDIHFHIAGLSGRRYGDGPLHECTVDGWDIVLEINARGTFLTNQHAVRQMLKQPLDEFGLRGTVLNVGSVLAHSPAPDFFGTFAYAASKGALHAMTIHAAARYARDRIRFNLLVPALIDTPMAARAVADPAIGEYLAAKQPLANGPGSPADCAEAALYLCEPASRFVTGAALNVDGGWSVSEGRRAGGTGP